MAKLNSKHNIKIEINDTAYELIAHELTAKETEELEAKAQVLKDLEKKAQEVVRLEEDIEDNKALLEVVGILEKPPLIYKNMSLKKILREKQDELKAVNVSELSNAMFKTRVKMSLRGAEAEEFLKEIDTLGIGYQSVFEAIAQAISEAKEKK